MLLFGISSFCIYNDNESNSDDDYFKNNSIYDNDNDKVDDNVDRNIKDSNDDDDNNNLNDRYR